MTTTELPFGTIVERSPETPTLPTDPGLLRPLLDRERCVIFSGFQASLEDFQRITSALSEDFHTYRGGGFTVGRMSRAPVNNDKTVMTATGETQDFPMSLHGEMYYLGQPPDLIWFYCDVPAKKAGQTTIGDGVRVFQDLSPATQAKFRERRIRYDRRIAEGDWQVTFQTDSREGAEQFCRAQGMQLQWDEDGTALTQYRTSALRTSTAGEPAFINSLQLLANSEILMRSGAAAEFFKDVKINLVVRWEDGSPIEPEVLEDLAQATTRNEVEVSWQRGDIILVDNRSVMHGRRGSNDPNRRILVRMGNLREA